MDCLSSEHKRRHDYFLKLMQDRSTAFKNTHRILLIGTGESGKSTFVKQLKLLSSPNQTFPDMYREKFIAEIQRNIVQSLSNILNFMIMEDIQFSSNSPDLSSAKNQLFKVYSDVRICPDNISLYSENPDPVQRDEFYNNCTNLWNDDAVKETQLRGNEFLQIDCAQYFLDKIDVVRSSTYKPTDEDILQVRTKTLGIHTESILYNNVSFELIDVGGQREQRAKWIEAMTDGVTAVIFLTDVSAYDTMLEEDISVNRLRESYHLLGQVWTKSLLQEKSFILFLNKQDKLASKVRSKRNKIETFFPEFKDGKVKFTVEFLNELQNIRRKKGKGENDIWDKHFSYFLPAATASIANSGGRTAAHSVSANVTNDTMIMGEYSQIQSIVAKAFNESLIDSWILDGEDKTGIIANLMSNNEFMNFFNRLRSVPLYEIVTITHFIKMLFLNECEQTKTRRIYPYPTTAIDKRNVDRVFESCKDILQGKALTEIMV